MLVASIMLYFRELDSLYLYYEMQDSTGIIYLNNFIFFKSIK